MSCAVKRMFFRLLFFYGDTRHGDVIKDTSLDQRVCLFYRAQSLFALGPLWSLPIRFLHFLRTQTCQVAWHYREKNVNQYTPLLPTFCASLFILYKKNLSYWPLNQMIPWGEHKVAFQYLSVFFFKATACPPLYVTLLLIKGFLMNLDCQADCGELQWLRQLRPWTQDATAAVHTICKARNYFLFAPASLCHNDLAV